MSKSIALGLLCAGALLLAALLTGCSDEPSPTPSATPTPTMAPTATSTPEPTPAPTPTMAPTHTPTPEPTPAAAPTPTMAPTHTSTPVPTPAAATLSLDEYLTYCAPSEQELADDATYGDVSVLAAELIQRLEAMVPPADLVEWHQLHIEFFRTVQAIFDRFPKDDVIDDAKMDEFLLAVAPDLEEKYGGLEEKLSEVAVRLPEHLRQQMIEVDCLNPDIVPDEYDDPDDHGNNFESATRIAIGEAVAIELEFRLDKDVLVFLAEPGTEYEFTLDWESYSRLRNTARPILALFDAGGQELVRLNHYVFGSQDKMMWQAVTRGDYYIVVGDTVTHGSITLTVTDGEATEQLGRDDHGNDIDDATVAAVGVDVEGVIDYPGDYDYFRFTAEEGQIYQIDVDLGSLPDSVLVLLGPDGWELAYNDDHGDSWASRVVWLARESGVHYLVVEANGSADVGNYTLTVSHSTIVDDHGNDIDDATAIRVGADVQGALDYDDDIDFFRFQAERGQSYQIDVALGTLDDSIVDLYDVDWSFLDSNDDYGDTLASRLFWEAPNSGERYVAVYGYGTGTYTLTVSIIDDHGNGFESATRIAIGEAVAIELEDIDDIDVLVFLAEPGRDYVITLDWESYSFRQSYTARPIVALFDADGQEHTRLMGYDYYENGVQSIDLMWRAVTGGDYYIVVGDGNTDGSLTLTVTGGEETEQLDRDDATVAPTATPTPEPTPVPTPAAATLSLDEYLTLCVTTELELADDATFGDLSSELAAEADRFEALTPPAQLSEWHLLNIEGFRTIQAFVELQPKDDVIDFIRFFLMASISADSEEKLGEAAARLPEDVLQRMIEAGCIDPEDVPDDNEDVPYDNEDVLDDHGDDIDDATVAAVGADVEGAIGYLGDSDYFRFTAEEGQFYQIDVGLGTLEDSVLELLGADGWRLAYNRDHGDSQASRIVWEAPASGDYYLVVEASGFADVGSYTLTVSVLEITDDHGGSAADASAVTVGESIEGAVNYLGDEDVFLFQVEAGAIYEIEVTLGTLADSDLVVYDEPDEWKGRFYSPVLSVKTYRNVWRSEYTGDSYLVVGFPGNESGSYTVEVARITLAGNTSYDTDGDGLIEVSGLMQLNAIRWDLDGDGLPDSSSGMAGFAAAFPGALDGMGCPDSECSGYELISDLDFDTNGNGRADAGDDYWNDGQGWAPIGDDFEADFESFIQRRRLHHLQPVHRSQGRSVRRAVREYWVQRE